MVTSYVRCDDCRTVEQLKDIDHKRAEQKNGWYIGRLKILCPKCSKKNSR